MSGITFTYNYTAAGSKAPVITLVADKVDEPQPDIVCNVPIDNMNLLFQFEQDVVNTATKVGGITGAASENDRILRLDFLPLDQYVRGIHNGLVNSGNTFAHDGQAAPETLTKKSVSLTTSSGDSLLNKLPAAALISRTNGQMALVELLIDTLQSGPLFYNPNNMSADDSATFAIRQLFGQAVEQGMLSTDNTDETNEAYVSNGIGFPAFKVLFEEGQYLDINVNFTISSDVVYQVQSALGGQISRGAGTFKVGNEVFEIDNNGNLKRVNGTGSSSVVNVRYNMRFIATNSNASSLSFTDSVVATAYDNAIKQLVSLYSIPPTPPPTTSAQVHAFDLKLRNAVLNSTQLVDFKNKITFIADFVANSSSDLDYSFLKKTGLLPSYEAITWFKNTPTLLDAGFDTFPETDFITNNMPLLNKTESPFISGTQIPFGPPLRNNSASNFTLTTKYNRTNFDILWTIVYPSGGVVTLPTWTARNLFVIPWVFATLSITDPISNKTVVLTKSSSVVTNNTVLTSSDTTQVAAVYGCATDKSWIAIGPTDQMIAEYLLNTSSAPRTTNRFAYYYQENANGEYSLNMRFNNTLHVGKCYVRDPSDGLVKLDEDVSSSFKIVTTGFNPTSNANTGDKDFAVLPPSGIRYKISAVPRTPSNGKILDGLFSTTEPSLMADSYVFVYNTGVNLVKVGVYLKHTGGTDKRVYFRRAFTNTSNADTIFSLENTVALAANNGTVVSFPSSAAALSVITGRLLSTQINGRNFLRMVVTAPSSSPNPNLITYIPDLANGNLFNTLFSTTPTVIADTFYYAGSIWSSTRLTSVGVLKIFSNSTQTFTTSGAPSDNYVSAPALADIDVSNNKIDVLIGTTTNLRYKIDVLTTPTQVYDRYSDLYLASLQALTGASSVNTKLLGTATEHTSTAILHVDLDDAGTGLVIKIDDRLVPDSVKFNLSNWAMYYVSKADAGAAVVKTECALNTVLQTSVGAKFISATCPLGTDVPVGYMFLFVSKSGQQNNNIYVYVPKLNLATYNVKVVVAAREASFNSLNAQYKDGEVVSIPNEGNVDALSNVSQYPMLLRLVEPNYGYIYYFCLAEPLYRNPFVDGSRWVTLYNLLYVDGNTSGANKLGGDPRNQFTEFSSLIANKTADQVSFITFTSQACTCVFETTEDTTKYYLCSRVPPLAKRLLSPSAAGMNRYWSEVTPMADLTGYFNNGSTYPAYTPIAPGPSPAPGPATGTLPATANFYDVVVTTPDEAIFEATLNGLAMTPAEQIVVTPPYLIRLTFEGISSFIVGNDAEVTLMLESASGVIPLEDGIAFVGNLSEQFSTEPEDGIIADKAAYVSATTALTANNVVAENGEYFLIKNGVTPTDIPSINPTSYRQFTVGTVEIKPPIGGS
jgi:hypothetical protein